jgi:histidinol-phosphate aminotransferase
VSDRLGPEELVRPAYRAMELYAPNRRPCAIDLSDNTNLAGVPPAAREVMLEAATPTLTRYPSLYGAELKRAISAYTGVAEEHVVTGCGSDDVLDSAIRALAEPGDVIGFPEPTFQMLPAFATMNGLEPRAVPLLSNLDVDAEGLLATNARITYVCSPNNPTGSLASGRAIDALLERARGVVIVDEAYVEYGGESLAKRAASSDRLLVVRTLSKAFGLAGMRVGYGIGARAIVEAVEKSRGPYKVTSLAERMAVAALDRDIPWVKARVAEVLESRARFAAFLGAIGRTAVPSHANFVLVPVDEAPSLGARLRERGVAVRPFPKLHAIGDALRISVGPWAIMEAALPSFEELLRCA